MYHTTTEKLAVGPIQSAIFPQLELSFELLLLPKMQRACITYRRQPISIA